METSEAEAPTELSTAMAEAFPAVEIEKELNPSLNTVVEVNPISSHVVADEEIKRDEAVEQKREKERSDALQMLKSAVLISAAIVAITGAAFTITRKLREK